MMSRRSDTSPRIFQADIPTLPPFSQLLRRQDIEDDEWHEHNLLPPTTQPSPSPPAHSLPSFRYFDKDPRTSNSYPSDSYRYGTRPIETQPLAPRPDCYYQQQIPDAVIDPSLREQHTSRTRSSYDDKRAPRYIQGRSAVARDLGPAMLLPMTSPKEPPNAYPQLVERPYNPHQFNFCPSTEASTATPPLIGVQIGNKADVRPTYSMRGYGQCEAVQRGDYDGDEWHCHQRTPISPGFPIHAAPNTLDYEGYRYPPMRPPTPPNTNTSSPTPPSPHSPPPHSEQYSPIARPSNILEVDEHSSYSHTSPASHTAQNSDEISSQSSSQNPKTSCTHTKDSLNSGQKRKREEYKSRQATYVGHTSPGIGADSAPRSHPEELTSGQKNTVTSNTVVGTADGSAFRSSSLALRPDQKLAKVRTEASTSKTKASPTGEGINVVRKRNVGQKRGSLRREWTGPEPPEPLPPLYDYRRARRSAKGKASVRESWRVDIVASETQRQAGGPVEFQEKGDASSGLMRNTGIPKIPGVSREVEHTSRAAEEVTRGEARNESHAPSRPRPKPRRKQILSSSAPEQEESQQQQSSFISTPPTPSQPVSHDLDQVMN